MKNLAEIIEEAKEIENLKKLTDEEIDGTIKKLINEKVRRGVVEKIKQLAEVIQ